MAEQIDTSTRTQLNDVEVRNSSAKQTPNTSFGQVLRSGMSGTSNAVTRQLSSAGYVIPGASVVGAAINGIGNVRDSSSPTASGVGMGGGGGSSSLGGGIGGVGREISGGGGGLLTGGLGGTNLGGSNAGSAGLTTGSNSSGALLAATQQLTESNNQFNLQYLGLQENMQQENREFTAVSNVIKSKNDTAKNSLSNLK